MFLTLLRSKSSLDCESESPVGAGWARGAEASDTLIHTHFTFDDYRGDPPHARASITWADVEELVAKFAEKDHPAALRLMRAGKLASAVEELAKNSPHSR
jgi:hypothetical protein